MARKWLNLFAGAALSFAVAGNALADEGKITVFAAASLTNAMQDIATQFKKEVKVVATFPEDSHKKVEYPVAVVEGHNNATVKAFYDYLKGPQAAEIFKRYGFTIK